MNEKRSNPYQHTTTQPEERIHCPICQKWRAHVRRVQGRHEFYRCKTCGNEQFYTRREFPERD